MALKVGSANVSAVRVGSALASKMMLGTTQVWPTAALPVPKLVRSGRGASATTVTIDVTGGRTLFLIRNNSSTSLSSNNAGVTLLQADTGGPRRNSVWNIAAGTSGNVTFTGATAALWGYCVVDLPVRNVNAAYIGNNTTSTMEGQPLTITGSPTPVMIWWNANAQCTWSAPPSGFVSLETITTQNSEPSWMLAYSTDAKAVGTYTPPNVDRGINGTSRIELEAVTSLA